MDLGLKDKTAIVTGAAKGVGKAIAMALAAEGVKVAIADIDECGAEKTADEIAANGGTALAIKTDVSKEDQVNAMVDKVIQEFGVIDILVPNAGVVGPQGPWVKLTAEGFDHVIGVNFKGVFLCCKAVIPYMIKRRSGKIINMSSCAAKTGEPNNGAYSATKAAVWNMTQSLAGELGQYNINVNAVCPAAMDTDLMEKVYRERAEHFGLTPEQLRQKIASSFILPDKLTTQDAANVVLFLASKLADRMTGQAINITGGIEMH